MQPPAETYTNDSVECPHCGHVRHDEYYELEDGDEYTCGHCEGTATLTVWTQMHFTARPKRCAAVSAGVRQVTRTLAHVLLAYLCAAIEGARWVVADRRLRQHEMDADTVELRAFLARYREAIRP